MPKKYRLKVGEKFLVETGRKTTRSWGLRGRKVNKFRSWASKWGPGNVHLVVFDPALGCYFKGCVKTEGDIILGGIANYGNVLKNEPLTCKRCIKYWGVNA